jgi:hypothetical protein
MTEVKVKRAHIAWESDERGSDDGYWLSLKRGWKWAGDPLGALHSIHEPTRAACMRERVMRCNCQDCVSSWAERNQQPLPPPLTLD